MASSMAAEASGSGEEYTEEAVEHPRPTKKPPEEGLACLILEVYESRRKGEGGLFGGNQPTYLFWFETKIFQSTK